MCIVRFTINDKEYRFNTRRVEECPQSTLSSYILINKRYDSAGVIAEKNKMFDEALDKTTQEEWEGVILPLYIDEYMEKKDVATEERRKELFIIWNINTQNENGLVHLINNTHSFVESFFKGIYHGSSSVNCSS